MTPRSNVIKLVKKNYNSHSRALSEADCGCFSIHLGH